MTQDQNNLLDAAIRKSTGDQQASLESMKHRYSQFVAALEGYDASIYDYDNDCDARVAIESAASECGDLIHRSISRLLRHLDEQFEAATVETSRTRYTDPWHTRLPKNPGSELATDINSGNL
jgi:hypothetical protein